MARVRKERNRNPFIVVFWEGESEEAYMRFIRREFHEKANVTVNKKKGVFKASVKAFALKGEFYNVLSEIDEVWFVFDTEPDLRGKWEEYYSIIQKVRRLCKNARVRLLMTRGCIEYFFLLHYEKAAPMIAGPADKENIIRRLKDHYCSQYQKGDFVSISEIAVHYMTGVENGAWSLKRIQNEIGSIEDSDERNRKLFLTDSTFTNVHEGISYLLSLKKYNEDEIKKA